MSLLLCNSFFKIFLFTPTGCVDVWEPKVLRAAMGAHFRQPIYPSLNWDDIENHLPKPVTVYVGDSSIGPERSKELEDKSAGLSHKPSKAGDYGWVSTKPNRDNKHYEEYDSDSDCEDEALSLPRVGTQLYHETWAQGPTAVVIGGETHGLSLEAVQLVEKTAGQRLFIPIVPVMDSLNSAMAASILLFEGRKQLLNVMQTAKRKQKSKVDHRFSWSPPVLHVNAQYMWILICYFLSTPCSKDVHCAFIDHKEKQQIFMFLKIKWGKHLEFA